MAQLRSEASPRLDSNPLSADKRRINLMAIVDDYAAIAAQLRRIQAERASEEQPNPALSSARP